MPRWEGGSRERLKAACRQDNVCWLLHSQVGVPVSFVLVREALLCLLWPGGVKLAEEIPYRAVVLSAWSGFPALEVARVPSHSSQHLLG